MVAYGGEFEPPSQSTCDGTEGSFARYPTTSKAFTPRALALRWNFWTLPPPYGIQTVPRTAFIDVNQAKIIVDYINVRGYAKAHLQIPEPLSEGFSGESSGRLVTMAVSGSAEGYRKLMLRDQDWTEPQTFFEFMDEMLQEIGPAGDGNRRVFMMDELDIDVFHNLFIIQKIIHAGHEVVFRAPYWSKDGPIEYFFNALDGGLRKGMLNVQDIADIEERIKDVVRSHSDVVPFFEHLNIN